MASRTPSRKPRGRPMRWFSIFIGIVFVMPVVLILVFRFVPVPGTPQMVLGLLSGEGAHYSWREFDEIAPSLPSAVIAAEDQRFCSHNGFDWASIDKAVKEHERGRRLRGASTPVSYTHLDVYKRQAFAPAPDGCGLQH